MDTRLTKNELKVLAALYSFCCKSGKCHPSKHQLSERTGIQECRISNITRQLSVYGWLKKTGHGGRNQRANYHLKTSAETALVNQHQNSTSKVKITSAETRNKSSAETALRNKHTSKHTSTTCLKSKFTDKDLSGAKWILERIRDVYPGQPEPDIEKWANTIRLIRERDKHTHKEIAEVFTWANQHDFWGAQIRSPSKLREKWHTLQSQRQRDNEASTRTPGKTRENIHAEAYAEFASAGQVDSGGIREDENPLWRTVDEADRRDKARCAKSDEGVAEGAVILHG